jgi:hypothetical protein
MLLTDSQRRLIHNCGIGDPVSLKNADPSKPFVYDRSYGFFPVGWGEHKELMSLLLAFHLGYKTIPELTEETGLDWPYRTADTFLETVPGTCYLSSVGRCIEAGKSKNLTPSERRFFGDIDYLFEDVL